MKISLRMQAILLILLATLLLVNCSGGAPGCPQVSFGSSTCSPGQTGFGSGGGSGGSGGGGGGGGGNNGTPTTFAYAVDENGSVDGYAFSATGNSFASISGYTQPIIPTNLGGVGAVVAQGKFLYVVLQDTQQIYGYTIGSTGSLTALTGFPMSVSLTGIADTTYNQYVVITNPAGTLLFISEFGTEEILVFQISNTGALTQANGSPFSTLPAGIEPQNMAMDGLGRFLYVAEDSLDHNGSTITIYSVSSSGQLTLNAITVNDALWEMAGDPSGNYLVGISGITKSIYGQDDDHLYVYSINQTTGGLTAVSGSPFVTQYAPFNLTIDPSSADGEYVYSFSINDSGTGANPIEAYSLNTSTGALTAVTGSPFSNLTVSPWGQFDQSGGYLFVYTGVSPDFSLGVMSVGGTGALTENVSTVPLVTGGYWAVADVP